LHRLSLFLLLAVLHTWPLASDPATLSRNDNADTVLNEWILAWVAHQLPRDPLNLFQANIFYPEPRTLAFSEHLLVPSLMVAPLLWLGASPVLAYNLLLIAGFALTGWATCLLVERWTSDLWAGILAGSLAAFNAHTLTRLPHIQAIHFEFVALALLALDRVLADRRVRDAVWLGIWCGLQALCSAYSMVFTCFAVGLGAVARPVEWLGGRWRRLVPLMALAVAVGALMVVPFLLPYRTARAEQGLNRSIEEVARYSAAPSDYLATGGRFHFWLWSHKFYRHTDALFPGLAALGLALFAIGSGTALRDRRARMALVFGVVSFVLSFGPRVPIYGVLYAWLPLLQGIRGAARFGQLTLLAIAVMAGFGLADIRRRLRRRALSPAAVGTIAVALIVVANAESLRAPLWYSRFEGIPGVYSVLAGEPEAVVAELPFFNLPRVSRNADYMLASTRHWKPMINGYSGFIPLSYRERMQTLLGFPDDRSFDTLRAAGVTHLIVHIATITEPERLDRDPRLQVIATGRGIKVYRLL
jgi:hypothetical protein